MWSLHGFSEESYLSGLSCVYVEVFGEALEVSWIPLEARVDCGMAHQTCRREVEVDNVRSGILWRSGWENRVSRPEVDEADGRAGAQVA